MGCCVSIPGPKQDQNAPKNQQPQLRSHESNFRIPPLVEEESVKEVLSETPISKPQQVPILTPQTKTQLPVIQHKKVPINKAFESEEVSFVTETCSNSESFSTTTTTTVTENREDEATSKRSIREGTRNRKRSYTVDGSRIGGRERRPKSPARKPDIPPEKMPANTRSVCRREAGEGPDRRSKSPSCARTVGPVPAGISSGRRELPVGDCHRLRLLKRKTVAFGWRSHLRTRLFLWSVLFFCRFWKHVCNSRFWVSRSDFQNGHVLHISIRFECLFIRERWS